MSGFFSRHYQVLTCKCSFQCSIPFNMCIILLPVLLRLRHNFLLDSFDLYIHILHTCFLHSYICVLCYCMSFLSVLRIPILLSLQLSWWWHGNGMDHYDVVVMCRIFAWFLQTASRVNFIPSSRHTGYQDPYVPNFFLLKPVYWGLYYSDIPMVKSVPVITLRPRQNERHFSRWHFQMQFLEWRCINCD